MIIRTLPALVLSVLVACSPTTSTPEQPNEEDLPKEASKEAPAPQPSVPPETYEIYFEGVGGIALEPDQVRSVIDGCVRTGAVFENDRPIPPPAKPHGRILVVVGPREVHVATEGLANRSCLTEGVAPLAKGAAAGSAIGIRVATTADVARTMRTIRLFAPGKALGAEDRGSATVLWDAPTLLDMVLRGPLQGCVGQVTEVESHRFSIKGSVVEMDGADALSACLAPALRKDRFDASMDALEASGVVVLAPARSALKVSSVGASDTEEDVLLEAARRCPLPESGVSFHFEVDADGALNFERGVADRKVFRDPSPLATCIAKNTSLPGSTKVGLYYTFH